MHAYGFYKFCQIMKAVNLRIDVQCRTHLGTKPMSSVQPHLMLNLVENIEWLYDPHKLTLLKAY